MKTFDAKQYGGAPLVVKTHGNAKAMEVKNSLLQCVKFQREKVNEKIIASISAEKLDEAEA